MIHTDSLCENLLMHMVHYDKSTKMVSLNFTPKCYFSKNTYSKSSLVTQNGLQLEISGSNTL